MILKKFIKVYPNTIDLKQASILVRLNSKLNFEKAGVSEKNLINEKIRKVDRYPLSYLDKSLTIVHWSHLLNLKIKAVMNYYLKDINVEYFYKSINTVNQIDFLKYEKTFHYDFHIDDGPFFNRTLSCIIFLNNDYKGGKLTFKNTLDDEEYEIEPIPGSSVIWPSNFLFPHTIKPIEEGVRFSIVAWGH